LCEIVEIRVVNWNRQIMDWWLRFATAANCMNLL